MSNQYHRSQTTYLEYVNFFVVNRNTIHNILSTKTLALKFPISVCCLYDHRSIERSILSIETKALATKYQSYWVIN